MDEQDGVYVAAARPADPEDAAPVNPDLAKLRAYTQAKLFLAEQLRLLREALTTLGREASERRCGELLVKLAEDRFTLAVVGQFKRGKSSLMNAIIGRELLPTGVLPLTSAITVLKYGVAERLVVRRENSLFPDELPVAALADYVTEKGNPSNQKKVKTATVELPVPFLRRGVEFVDTPGVGSVVTANTATTYGFLPECDAVLFVISVDTPLTSLELAFLREIREYVNRIFFVVNKLDLVSPAEQEAVLTFVTDTIRQQIGGAAIKVFPVSARQGLAARLAGDLAGYEQSGMKALEETLAAFLAEEKSQAFLAAVLHKALQIGDAAMEQNFCQEATGQKDSGNGGEKSAGTTRRDGSAVTLIMAVQAKLAALAKRMQENQPAALLAGDFLPGIPLPVEAVNPAAFAVPAAAPAKHLPGLGSKGCPVCRHLENYGREFFRRWQYQISMQEEDQAGFAAELGFCPLHTWQLLALASAHGASVGYARLAEEAARRLHRISDGPAREEKLRQLVHDSRNCRVCRLLRQAEADYIGQLAVWLGEAAGRRWYRRSQGVCLRHLSLLVAAVDADDQQFLIDHGAQRFEEAAEDMRSYALKHEAVRRELQNRDEEEAYRQAVIHLVGERYVCIPWPEDGSL